MDNNSSKIPCLPETHDCVGHPTSLLVPQGLRLELSRSKIVEGQEGKLKEWMSVFKDRYDESLTTIELLPRSWTEKSVTNIWGAFQCAQEAH